MSDLILINEEIDILNKKLDKILLIIENNSINCKKMGDHISFIEEVYGKIKLPLNYLLNKICYMFNIEEIKL